VDCDSVTSVGARCLDFHSSQPATEIMTLAERPDQSDVNESGVLYGILRQEVPERCRDLVEARWT